jgi:hypothetical protein
MSTLTATKSPSLTQLIAPIVGLWADQKTDPNSPRRQDLLKYKANIILNFFAHVDRSPGEITPLEVKAYQAELEGQGLKPSTVYARLSQLSSFYEWCQFSGVNVPPLFGNNAPPLFGNDAPLLFGNDAPPA